MENEKSPKLSFQVMGRRIHYDHETKYLASMLIFMLTAQPLSMVLMHIDNHFKYADYVEKDDDEHISSYHAEDPRLINHIRRYYLTEPSSRNVPYNLKNPHFRHWSQKTQSLLVEQLLPHTKNGFFVECGAFDGEHMSNTLSFEKYLNWTGLLIEPDHANLKVLKRKNRKSWILAGCLGDSDYPKKVSLYGGAYISSIESQMDFMRNLFIRTWAPVKSLQRVWCFPFLSILKAINQTKIDYFSLDVEGPELEILKSIPWSKVDIKLLQVEYKVFHGLYFDGQEALKREALLKDIVGNGSTSKYVMAKKLYYDMYFLKSD